MEIAKALILVDGRANEHSWPSAAPDAKPLFPIANRPILIHHLEALRAAGVLEAAILVHGASGAAIHDIVGDGRAWGISVRHGAWDAPAGLSAALAAGREFIAGEPVLVQRAGTLLQARMHAHISAFARERLDALALQSDGAHGYLLSPRAVAALTRPRGPVGDPVAGVEADGGRVRVLAADGCVACDGDLDTLLDSNRRVLQALEPSEDLSRLSECTVQGAISVHPTALVERTLLRGPAIIGPGARVSDAYIGPYTSIGAGAVIEGTEIEHSIVLSGAQLRFVGTRLESSVIGRGARVARGFELPGAIRMSLGDGADVVLR